MKIIYVHHADRKRDKSVPRQEQDITEDGIVDANLVGKKLSRIKVKAIYTSNYLRCVHTANILNEYLNTNIIEEAFLNEMESYETLKELQIRTMNGLDKIISENDSDDVIICVTSGVNLTGFLSYFSKLEPSNSNPLVQGITCSPVLFSTDNTCF